MRTRCTGWAIEFTPRPLPGEGKIGRQPYLLGRYCLPGHIPPQFGGYCTAVFATRRKAREAAAESRRYTPRGDRKDCTLYQRVRVVRVRVTVKPT